MEAFEFSIAATWTDRFHGVSREARPPTTKIIRYLRTKNAVEGPSELRW
jgi:hypothetical protein